MGKFIARLVVGLALLYGVGAGIFAFTNYSGEKPAVPTILGDFNGWLVSFWETRVNPKPAKPPEAVPSTSPTLAPTSDPTPEPTPEPTPAPASAGVRLPPEGLAGEDLELWKIEHVVLPDAAKQARLLRDMSRADSAAFEAARTSVMASLGEARTLLGTILERDSSQRQANRLWNGLQELYAAVKKL